MMQRLFFFGRVAVVAACFAQPVDAAGWGGIGGGVNGSGSVAVGGGHASVSSGSHVSAAAHVVSPGAGHYYHGSTFAGQSRVGTGMAPSVIHANSGVAPVLMSHASPAVVPSVGHVGPAVMPSVNMNRAFVQPQVSNSSLAFGGTMAAIRGGGRAFSPPGDVTRHWNRDHFHTWNHHRYRCFNGGWIYVDNGFPYGDFSSAETNNYQPYPYPAYTPYLNGYVDNGQAPINGGAEGDQPSASQPLASDGSDYGTPDTLIVSVQNALVHLGYATGVSDGRFGPMTENALSHFQRDHNLPVTGRIDGMTLRVLGLL